MNRRLRRLRRSGPSQAPSVGARRRPNRESRDSRDGQSRISGTRSRCHVSLRATATRETKDALMRLSLVRTEGRIPNIGNRWALSCTQQGRYRPIFVTPIPRGPSFAESEIGVIDTRGRPVVPKISDSQILFIHSSSYSGFQQGEVWRSIFDFSQCVYISTVRTRRGRIRIRKIRLYAYVCQLC